MLNKGALMKNLPLAEIITMIMKLIKIFTRGKKRETQTNEQKTFEKNVQENLWFPSN